MDDIIISFLEANSNKISFSLEEMIAKMGIRGEKNLKKFKRSLERLISSGKIYFNYRDNMYMLFENSNMHKGTLLIDNKKRYYVIDGDSRYFLQSDNLHHASYGDYVLISYNEKKHGYEVNKILKKDGNRYVAEVCYYDGEMCVYDDKFGYLQIVNDVEFVPGSLVLIERDMGKAKILETICHKDDANARTLRVVYEHGFSNEFSKEVYRQLENIPNSLSDNMINNELLLGRVDMRDKDMVTIDCDTTKDIDDGIYIEKNSDGTTSLYVFIADVSYYVKDGDALSVRIKEAGTSVYPPGCVIPMLPRKLSNGICSLNPKVDRFAICFKSTFTDDGELVNFDVFKAIVNSKIKMTYSNVDKILMDNEMVPGYEKFYKQLLLMERLYLIIQDKFYKNGFLEFNSSEFDFILDSNDRIREINKNIQGIGDKIIEFFMLITNKNACEYFSNLNIPLVYRIDGEPNFKKISDVIVMLQDKKYLDKSINAYENDEVRDEYTKEEIQKILNDLKKMELPEVFYQMLIRTMSKARFSVDNIGHYPLGLTHYAQFTSPIRRGGDWRNHTILNYYLSNNKDPMATIKRFSNSSLEKETDIYSDREREAEAVEAEINQMLLLEYIESHKEKLNEDELIGRVSEIGTSVRVLLDNGIKGKINVPLGIGRISGNNLYVGDRLVCSVGDMVSVKIDGVKYKNGEVFLSLEKNLEKENYINGKEKSEKKIKIRKYIPSN